MRSKQLPVLGAISTIISIIVPLKIKTETPTQDKKVKIIIINFFKRVLISDRLFTATNFAPIDAVA